MDTISTEILKLISSYLSCYLIDTSFYMTSKYLYSLQKCKLVKFKSLCACSYHTKKKYIFNAIFTLKDKEIEFEKYGSIYAIHFNSNKALKLSKKYRPMFGEVSRHMLHYCSKGLVVFLFTLRVVQTLEHAHNINIFMQARVA